MGFERMPDRDMTMWRLILIDCCWWPWLTADQERLYSSRYESGPMPSQWSYPTRDVALLLLSERFCPHLTLDAWHQVQPNHRNAVSLLLAVSTLGLTVCLWWKEHCCLVGWRVAWDMFGVLFHQMWFEPSPLLVSLRCFDYRRWLCRYDQPLIAGNGRSSNLSSCSLTILRIKSETSTFCLWRRLPPAKRSSSIKAIKSWKFSSLPLWGWLSLTRSGAWCVKGVALTDTVWCI